MKTIKQIADELGVTKEAIRQQVAKLPPSYVTIGANRTKYINDDGQAILRQTVASKVTSKEPSLLPSEKEKDDKLDTLITMLQKELDTKTEQLSIKDSQIEALNKRLAEAQQLLHQQQQLNAIAEQKILALEAKENQESEPEPNQKKWYQFWK